MKPGDMVVARTMGSNVTLWDSPSSNLPPGDRAGVFKYGDIGFVIAVTSVLGYNDACIVCNSGLGWTLIHRLQRCG